MRKAEREAMEYFIAMNTLQAEALLDFIDEQIENSVPTQEAQPKPKPKPKPPAKPKPAPSKPGAYAENPYASWDSETLKTEMERRGKPTRSLSDNDMARVLFLEDRKSEGWDPRNEPDPKLRFAKEPGPDGVDHSDDGKKRNI